MICPTCGLRITNAKIDIHTMACLSWRAAIDRNEPHDLIARYWDAAQSTR